MSRIAATPAFVLAASCFRGVQLADNGSSGMTQNWAILAMFVSASVAAACVAIGCAVVRRSAD